MFNPEEIIFSTTTACNLRCAHCFINRSPASLNAHDAIRFLQSARESEESSIERVGFSGGEPFLCVDFLESVIKAAVECDFMFDRIMTNGDWWKSEAELRETLQKIYDAGYDGKIGVSYDSFHAQSEERIATFIQTAWEIFGSDSVEIQSVLDSKRGSLPLAPTASAFSATPSTGANAPVTPPSVSCMLRSLANRLNLAYEEQISKSGRGIATLSGEGIFLPAYIQTESFQANDERAFKDKKWFKEDFCEAMGQILFIHATGNIAPCCGFANENEALFIGTIRNSFGTVLQNAKSSPMIRLCFEEGLSSKIKPLQAEGKLPGKTGDQCTFCDFLCKIAKN